MAGASPPIAIAELRRWLERREIRTPGPAEVLPFGITDMDARLPGGGLQRGRLHEVIEGGAAGEFAAVATLFAAGIAEDCLAQFFGVCVAAICSPQRLPASAFIRAA